MCCVVVGWCVGLLLCRLCVCCVYLPTCCSCVCCPFVMCFFFCVFVLSVCCIVSFVGCRALWFVSLPVSCVVCMCVAVLDTCVVWFFVYCVVLYCHSATRNVFNKSLCRITACVCWCVGCDVSVCWCLVNLACLFLCVWGGVCICRPAERGRYECFIDSWARFWLNV